MKAIWRANPYGPKWPPWDKFRAKGVTDIYFPTRRLEFSTGKYIRNDLQLYFDYKQGVESQGFGYRLCRDPSWDSIFDPIQLVSSAVSDIRSVSTGYIPYMFDIEYHNPDYVETTFKEFRKVFPKGPVAWTLEPFQAGWFTDSLIDTLNNDINLVVVVQNFFGNMAPAGKRNGRTPAEELLDAGISTNRVKTFYDGQLALPAGWDGTILSEERI